MKSMLRHGICLLSLMLALVAVAPAQAARYGGDFAHPRQLLARAHAAEHGRGLTLNQAAAKASRQLHGRVLAAQRVRRDGRVMYRIKLLMANGVVRIVYVDAQSGRLE
jgi:uncharacterized membrane protein YkoI